MKGSAKCKHGLALNRRGVCRECRKQYMREYNKSPAGISAKRRATVKRAVKDAIEAGIHPSIRREIENRRLDRELEERLNG
jgi:hypothetical protein